MTVRYTRGDILRCSEVEAVVNPVNCVGVMGKGLALQFRKRWPENFAAYKIACDSGELQIGTVHIHKLALPGRPSFIINLPTKVHWRDPSELDGVGRGVVSLARLLSDVGIRSVAIPALGCGLGGLAWVDVRPLLESTFKPMANVDALVFEPDPEGPAAFRRGRE
jgi:O-acetyl-ADP-ribose deacetylase (regulator of RNase III)